MIQLLQYGALDFCLKSSWHLLRFLQTETTEVSLVLGCQEQYMLLEVGKLLGMIFVLWNLLQAIPRKF